MPAATVLRHLHERRPIVAAVLLVALALSLLVDAEGLAALQRGLVLIAKDTNELSLTPSGDARLAMLRRQTG